MRRTERESWMRLSSSSLQSTLIQSCQTRRRSSREDSRSARDNSSLEQGNNRETEGVVARPHPSPPGPKQWSVTMLTLRFVWTLTLRLRSPHPSRR